MDWRIYSVGKVYAAELEGPVVVQTEHGPVEASRGDFLVVDEDLQHVLHYTREQFQRSFQLVDRPVPLRAMGRLSEIAVRCAVSPADESAGEVCARCGQHRTLSSFEGVAMCAECELALRAEREETLRCMHDGAPMRKEVIRQVIVDRCPECGGVWFDGGELEILGMILRRAADQTVPSAMATDLLQKLSERPAE